MRCAPWFCDDCGNPIPSLSALVSINADTVLCATCSQRRKDSGPQVTGGN